MGQLIEDQLGRHSPLTIIPPVREIIFGCAAVSLGLIFRLFAPEHVRTYPLVVGGS